jgi:transcriptional regulator with XRE-family HTH domain
MPRILVEVKKEEYKELRNLKGNKSWRQFFLETEKNLREALTIGFDYGKIKTVQALSQILTEKREETIKQFEELAKAFKETVESYKDVAEILEVLTIPKEEIVKRKKELEKHIPRELREKWIDFSKETK